MIKGIETYLANVLGCAVNVEAVTALEKKRAGWLANFYELRAADICGIRHVLAFAKAGQRYTPARVAKQFATFQDFNLPFVFVPRELGVHDVSRLIAAKVSYVLPFRSFFLPRAGIGVSKPLQKPVLRENFSVAAQLFICGYLTQRWDGCATIAQGMTRTGLSSASVVHAFREIEYFGAGDRNREDDGRTVLMKLKPAGEIWERCRKRFFNPVKRIVGVAERPDGTVVAGVDALAQLSELNEEEPTCFALPMKGFSSLGIEEIPSDAAPYQLQLWHYPPVLIGGAQIDSVSLFLSLRDEADDRVRIQLDKLEETFKW